MTKQCSCGEEIEMGATWCEFCHTNYDIAEPDPFEKELIKKWDKIDTIDPMFQMLVREGLNLTKPRKED